jgi:hypothetical protein
MPLLGESPGPTTPPITVDLNAVADTFVPVPFATYIVRRMTIYGASTTLAGSAATIGAYTATAAGGTAIVTPATAVALTAATKFLDRTIAATTDYLTPTAYTPAGGQTQYGLFIRVGVVHGAAATCKVVFELEGLS